MLTSSLSSFGTDDVNINLYMVYYWVIEQVAYKTKWDVNKKNWNLTLLSVRFQILSALTGGCILYPPPPRSTAGIDMDRVNFPPMQGLI